MAFEAFDRDRKIAKEAVVETSTSPAAAISAAAGVVADMANPLMRGLYQQYGGLMEQVTRFMSGEAEEENGAELDPMQQAVFMRLLGLLVI